MPNTEPARSEVSTAPAVLLTGASGYVGGRLVPLLEAQPLVLRCLARNPENLRPLVKTSTETVQGDVLDPPSLDAALKGVQTAYYLVHLMSGSHNFERADRQAAANFADANGTIVFPPFRDFSGHKDRCKSEVRAIDVVANATEGDTNNDADTSWGAMPRATAVP